MTVVLAAFDDRKKEVSALVNKTAYNIALACINWGTYLLFWQFHAQNYKLIKHFICRRQLYTVWFTD